MNTGILTIGRLESEDDRDPNARISVANLNIKAVDEVSNEDNEDEEVNKDAEEENAVVVAENAAIV